MIYMFTYSNRTALSTFLAGGKASPKLIRRLSKSSEDVNNDGQERRKSGGGNNMPFMNLDFDSKGRDNVVNHWL